MRSAPAAAAAVGRDDLDRRRRRSSCRCRRSAPSSPRRLRASSAASSCPIPNAPELAPAASQATTDESVDGIKCEQNARLVFHVHTHVTVFVNGKQRAIPAGVGIYPPIGPQNYRGDQFGVTAENCITWLSTRYADGLIHVESSEQRSFVLGDFFKVWGQPLSSDQVGPETGRRDRDRRTGRSGRATRPTSRSARTPRSSSRSASRSSAPQTIEFPGAF